MSLVKVCRGVVALSVGVSLGLLSGCSVSGLTNAAYGASCKPTHKRQQQTCKAPTIQRPPANPTRADLIGMGIPVTRWFALGRCEQPGPGVGGVDWRNDGPSFVGGLGFAASTWRAYKPAAYPDPPAATPWQIIIVAERVKADVGITAWGCHGAF